MALDIFLVYPIIAYVSILALVFNRKHLLMALLALEGGILGAIMTVAVVYGSVAQINAFLCIVVLTFGVVEARLGIALLVSMVRSTGSDLLKSVTIGYV